MRGPTGVVNDALQDGNEIASKVVSYLSSTQRNTSTNTNNNTGNRESSLIDLPPELTSKQARVVDYKGWKKINDKEVKDGEALGKIRLKIENVEEMLQTAEST